MVSELRLEPVFMSIEFETARFRAGRYDVASVKTATVDEANRAHQDMVTGAGWHTGPETVREQGPTVCTVLPGHEMVTTNQTVWRPCDECGAANVEGWTRGHRSVCEFCYDAGGWIVDPSPYGEGCTCCG